MNLAMGKPSDYNVVNVGSAMTAGEENPYRATLPAVMERLGYLIHLSEQHHELSADLARELSGVSTGYMTNVADKPPVPMMETAPSVIGHAQDFIQTIEKHLSGIRENLHHIQSITFSPKQLESRLK